MNFRSFAPSLRAALATSAALVCLILPSTRTASAQRLSQTVRPSHYDLTLTPDLKAATFSGVESIEVTLAEPTSHITINAIEIAFQSVSVTAHGKEQAATISLDNDKQQATFTFPAMLPAGKATLHIAYTGILNNELRGFYLSKGDHRNYAVTQFEATDARRAFPCFDEPAFKATFNVTLVVDKGDTAISNTSIEADTPGPALGKHTLKFFTTPKMSTYLVAFLVGDFQCTSGSSDGVALRVCSTPDKVALTPYALNIEKFALHYYDNYFGIHFPLKKLDLIAIPDFEAGAMENFGAITFRENALLLNPKTASLSAKENVTVDVTHEMAHQWFGDLVTMQWWDNIWLNEGFATWMENKATGVMHPEWNMPQVVAADEDSTLNLDAMPTTRAIRATANTPNEINQMFDGISYDKASEVLLMVENYLGPETFRKGVHNYLAAHEYSNATAQDFWNAQTAVSHKPVDKIMESLVVQPGEPILTFGQPSNGKVEVSQKRFYLSPGIQPNPAQKWTLPVCMTSAGQGHICQILTPTTTSLSVPPTGLFFANAGGKGYYRSAYTPSSYAALVAAVETTLTPTERIRLLGDEWAQTRAGKATVGDYFNLVAAVKTDPNAEVISSAVTGVDAIDDQIASTPEERAAISAWIRSNFAPQYARLGNPSASDTDNTRELRARLFDLLGDYGEDPAVIAQARKIAEEFLHNPGSVDPTQGQAALIIAARNGDAAFFDQLQHVYETSTNPEFQEGALRLLAMFKDPSLVQRALDYTVSGKVRNQDAAIQFAIALHFDENRELVWKYIQNNWGKINPMLTTEMGEILVSATGNFCSADARDDVQSFFATHKVSSSDLVLKHALEHIDGCIELRSLQEHNLKQWIDTQPK